MAPVHAVVLPFAERWTISPKKFLREIHDRSVWQVLGLYLATSWGVLNAVDVLTGFAGLPDWTPTMALVLLMIGLPIMVATAFLQGGLPGRQAEADEAGDQVSDPTAASNRLFTWRNAIGGGVLAGALLALAAGGYLLMWAFGIGSVGSLVAQGVLDAQDPILLADFENRTDDETLGPVVTGALGVDLGSSETVALLGRDVVRTNLGMMGRDPSQAINAEVAREIAIRENVKAYVAGEISRVGTRYLIVARIVSPVTDADLVSFREEAVGDDDLLPAIDRLSTRLREKLGESLRMIRVGAPLEQATTWSLDALRKLTQAEELEEAGDYESALRLLREAVAIDTAFAMGYRKIGVLLFNTGADDAALREASTLAYRHRDRLTERERYLTEANYHSNVTGDVQATIRAYRSALALNPDESAALNNLANNFRDLNRYDEALELLERATGGRGASSVAWFNLARMYLLVGDRPSAIEAQLQYEERFPGHIYAPFLELLLASFDGDKERVDRAVDVMEVDNRTLGLFGPRLPTFRMAAAVGVGAVGEALAAVEGRRVVGGALNNPGAPFPALERADILLWVLDDSARAIPAVQAIVGAPEFTEPPARERRWVEPILTLAAAGDETGARALLTRWEAEVAASDVEQGRFQLALSMVRLAEGDAAGASEAMRQSEGILGCLRCLEPYQALILERTGDPRGAIEIWERDRTRPTSVETAGWSRVVAAKRLGPLHEASGDTASAIAAYQALVDAWGAGDPELQPQVGRARARITALGGS
ncbi:MAG: tetratricopeptide repeat protein [Gemmatimonadetes bacterium]|nr:tetratricopeptide repeat protein [Gemmatimonadota bacterium]